MSVASHAPEGERRRRARRFSERRESGPAWAGRDRRFGLDRRGEERRCDPDARRTSAAGRASALRREAVAVGLVVLAAGLVLAELLVARGAVAQAAVDELVRAAAVWHGGAGSLEEIGFERAPLTALAHTPLTTSLEVSGTLVLAPLPTLAVGALMAGLLYGVLGRLGVGRGLRLAAVLAMALNPVAIALAVAGLPALMGASGLAVACHALIAWLGSGALRWLVLASCALAVGTLAWYPVLGFTALAGAVLAVVLVASTRPPGEVAGTLLLAVVPVLFVAALWSFLVWREIGELPRWGDAGPAGSAPAFGDGAFALLGGLAGAVALVPVALAVQMRRMTLAAGVAGLLLVPLVVVAVQRATGDGAVEAHAVLLIVVPAAAIGATAVMAPQARRGALPLVVALALALDGAALSILRSDPPDPVAGAVASMLTGGTAGATPGIERDLRLLVAGRRDLEPAPPGLLDGRPRRWEKPFAPAPGPWAPSRPLVR